MRQRLITLALAGMFSAVSGTTSAQTQHVDVALVLALDASGSIDGNRWKLQIEGYIKTFRDKDVVARIKSGPHQRIAVTMVHWSGANEQRQVIPWMILKNDADAEAFATAIEKTERIFKGHTSVGSALMFSAGLLLDTRFKALRKVIDISGDGAEDSGIPAMIARDLVVAQGITINGLPILGYEADVELYYEQNVIGGPGAFMVVAKSFEELANAIRIKLLSEMTNLESPRYALLGD